VERVARLEGDIAEVRVSLKDTGVVSFDSLELEQI
jgi:hypothetical protein